MLDKIYLEITNVCNLNCSFCHKTKREKRLMSDGEFDIILAKIQGKAKYLYFHLMGEPLLHPSLCEFIEKSKRSGFLPIITTNGSLLSQKGDQLLNALPYKISISLHAPAANEAFFDDGYFDSCISFAKQAAAKNCIAVLRLWNIGGEGENENAAVLEKLHRAFPNEWSPLLRESIRLSSDKVFLEWGEHFDWPDLTAEAIPCDSDIFCYALRDHIGILADGTVVPCCLDADANLTLGNIFESELFDILSSSRAKNIFDGFTKRRAVEELCKKCGYARRFSK